MISCMQSSANRFSGINAGYAAISSVGRSVFSFHFLSTFSLDWVTVCTKIRVRTMDVRRIRRVAHVGQSAAMTSNGTPSKTQGMAQRVRNVDEKFVLL